MAPSLPTISPQRVRSYILRLPLLTRVVLLLILLLWLLELQSAWDVARFGSLIPSEIGLSSMHRLNTYPVTHTGFLHALLNALALTPLLARFELESGTLLAAALLAGPLSTLPGGLYVLIERGILRSNTAVMGASVWVFELLGVEAIKTYRTNPYFSLGDFRIPTWTTPILPLICIAALVPNTSLLGHLCGLSVGYLYGLGYLRILAPPEKVLRWIEGKLNLLGRLPHYVSVDQKTYGRYGVLPSSTPSSAAALSEQGVPMSFAGPGQRVGP